MDRRMSASGVAHGARRSGSNGGVNGWTAAAMRGWSHRPRWDGVHCLSERSKPVFGFMA